MSLVGESAGRFSYVASQTLFGDRAQLASRTEVLIFAAELFAHAEHQDHYPAVHPPQRDGEPSAPTLSQAAPRKPDAT